MHEYKQTDTRPYLFYAHRFAVGKNIHDFNINAAKTANNK